MELKMFIGTSHHHVTKNNYKDMNAKIYPQAHRQLYYYSILSRVFQVSLFIFLPQGGARSRLNIYNATY
jgi:hypothetical protein